MDEKIKELQTYKIYGETIEPYLAEYWLGNGNAIKPEITIKTADIAGVLKNIMPYCEVCESWRNVGDSVIFRIPALRVILLKSFHFSVLWVK